MNSPTAIQGVYLTLFLHHFCTTYSVMSLETRWKAHPSLKVWFVFTIMGLAGHEAGMHGVRMIEECYTTCRLCYGTVTPFCGGQ